MAKQIYYFIKGENYAMKNKELWEKWEPEVHESSDAKKRIASAQKADLTPLKIEAREDKTYGYFQGRHGRYETSLEFCPCGDFHIRQMPCKHIYRLAMELHLIDGNIVNDTSKIKIPKAKNGLELIPSLDIIESCSEDAQKILLRLFSEIKKGTYRIVINKNDFAKELINKNILTEFDDDNLKHKELNKKEIVKRLKEKGLDVGIRKTPHEELIRLALLHLPEYVQNECSNKATVTINDLFANVRTKLKSYLLRKLYPPKYLDENMMEVIAYPNDEITALLKLRGFLEEDANIIGENVTIVSDYE